MPVFKRCYLKALDGISLSPGPNRVVVAGGLSGAGQPLAATFALTLDGGGEGRDEAPVQMAQ